MKFFTLENEKPNYGGKEKIYISGHYKDNQFFKTISKEILEIQNCQVYIDSGVILGDNNVSLEDRSLSLKQMNLIVFVITEKFFLDDCIARNFELEYAKQNNIPILPIAVKNGLSQEFNKTCGKFHLLKRDSADYSDKLKKYMDNLFNQYHMIGKVPITLDECKRSKIFISYRKVDKHYAEKAIEIIRSFVSLRDVEIWYDDFLTEGENYNDEIHTNLMECDIFLLVVTPNLLREPNYVLNIEYPNAKKSGKYILPLLMTDTDIVQLEEKYKGVNGITDSKDKRAILDFFNEVLKDMQIPEESYPYPAEKLFMLGCAYLEGKGMEYNPKIAISMLNDAANLGYHYALERLGNLYYMGIGVQQDYEKAMNYLKLAEDAFEKDGDECDIQGECVYHNARATRLAKLFDMCIENKDLESARQILDKRETSIAILMEKKDMYSFSNIYATNLMNRAQICQLEGDYYAAYFYYKKAREEIEFYEKNCKHQMCIYNALRFYRNLGNCLHLISATDTNPFYRQQAMASLLNAFKRSRYFNEFYKQGLEETQSIGDELMQIAMEYISIKDKFNAIEIYTIVHDEYTKFIEEFPGVPDILTVLAITKLNIAVTARPESGYELLQEATHIMRHLCLDYPENDEYRSIYNVALKQLNLWG